MTHLETVLKLGANVQAVCIDVEGSEPRHKTPFCLAADNGSTEAIRLLLQYGADPWENIENQPPPLLRAAAKCSVNVVYEMVQGWLVSGRNAGYNG